MAEVRPLSGTNGIVVWPCGCETKLKKGEAISAGCPKHERDRVRINAPWGFELACRLYTDEFCRVWLTDKNGDARVVFDPESGDNDFSRMFEIVEQGVEIELQKQADKRS